MRSRSFAVVAVLAAVGASVAFALDANAAVPGPPAGMTTVFSDDFTGAAGTGLNRSNWLYDIGTAYPGGAANWGTGEVETMTDSHAERVPGRQRQPGDQADPGRGRTLDVGPGRDAAHRLRGAGRRPGADRGATAATERQRRRGGRLLAGVLGARRGGPPGRRDELAEHRRVGHHGGHQRPQLACSATLHCGRARAARATRPPASAAASTPARLPDRLPHVRGGVRPQRLARADALVPRRRQLLHASTPPRSTRPPGTTRRTTACS